MVGPGSEASADAAVEGRRWHETKRLVLASTPAVKTHHRRDSCRLLGMKSQLASLGEVELCFLTTPDLA